MTRRLRIGAGAGYSGDRIEPALDLARRGELDYLVFECLAERTIALAQLARVSDPQAGFDPLLADRLRSVLPDCAARGIRIVTNMGAANPIAAAQLAREIATGLGLSGYKIAAVTGDDVLSSADLSNVDLDTGEGLDDLGDTIISANAYVGCAGIVDALQQGADLVIVGRAADPALYLGPLVHEFGWAMDDWDKLGKGTLAGHLMECAGQLTGGYFADPGVKDVERLDQLGFPIAEVNEDGDIELTKLPGTGGRLDEATVKEQLLYEIHDPANYLQPDVVADFSQVTVRSAGPDRVRVSGATGKARPATLKASVGYQNGFVGEGQISYAGAGALGRAELAREIVTRRLQTIGLNPRETRTDLIGMNALHGPDFGTSAPPYEIRLRVVALTDSRRDAERIGEEVESLYTNGPAGGGGARKAVREMISVASCLIDRAAVITVSHLIAEGLQ